MTGLVDLHRSVRAPHDERIRLLLMPFERGVSAVDAQAQAILFAERDLRAEEHALGAALVPNENVGVVVDAATLDEGAHVRTELLDLETGDVTREMFGMRADVTECTGAGTRGIGAPVGLFLTGRLDASGQPALRVFRYDLTDRSQLAGAHQCARLLHEWVSSVIVREREHDVVLPHDPDEGLR